MRLLPTTLLSTFIHTTFLAFSLSMVLACASTSTSSTTTASQGLSGITREQFNTRIQFLNIPLFWRHDINQNGALDPNELVVTWGYNTPIETYVQNGDWTPATKDIFQKLQDPSWDVTLKNPRLPSAAAPNSVTSISEIDRKIAVALELTQGRPTLVEYDRDSLSDSDKQIIANIAKAAAYIETIFMKQKGTYDLLNSVSKDDASSQRLFWRNLGPNAKAQKLKTILHVLPHPRYPPSFQVYTPAISKTKKTFVR